MRLEEPLEINEVNTPEKEVPFLEKLFEGGDYKPVDKKLLRALLDECSADEIEKAFTVLDSLSSTAKGKRTKITKAHIKSLRTHYNG